jgi:hypothetical protein
MAKKSETTTAAAESETKRGSVVYINAAGEESRSANKDVVILRFNFEDGVSVDFDIRATSDDIKLCAMAHGFNQKLRDSFAGKKGEEARKELETVSANLLGGFWTKPSKSGDGSSTNMTILVEAIVRGLQEEGQEVGADRVAGIKSKLAAMEDTKELMKKPAIAKHYKAIVAERAVAKANEAAKAEGADASLADAF